MSVTRPLSVFSYLFWLIEYILCRDSTDEQSTPIGDNTREMQSNIELLLFVIYNTVFQKKNSLFDVFFKFISEIQSCKITKTFHNPAAVLRRGPQNLLTPRVINFQLEPNSLT